MAKLLFLQLFTLAPPLKLDHQMKWLRSAQNELTAAEMSDHIRLTCCYWLDVIQYRLAAPVDTTKVRDQAQAACISAADVPAGGCH